MSFTLFRIVKTENKQVERLLERIAIAAERQADALENLVPPVEESGEMTVVEISPVLDPTEKQQELDEQEVPEY